MDNGKEMTVFDSAFLGFAFGGGIFDIIVAIWVASSRSAGEKLLIGFAAICLWVLLCACLILLAKKQEWHSSLFRLGKYMLNGDGERKYRDGVYKGNFVNNARSGKGVFEFKSGDRYEGDYKNDKITGYGTATWTSGSTYTGEFVKGKRTGYGTFSWSDGDMYTGDFIGNNHTGYGTYTWKNGNTYTGDFVNDKRTGHGTFTWKNGDTYTGGFVDGKRTGHGTFTCADGETYTGDFADDKRAGSGTNTWADGETYTGDYVDDKRIGRGTYTWKNGDTYIGDFVDGESTGKGILFCAETKKRFIGSFKDDKALTGYWYDSNNNLFEKWADRRQETVGAAIGRPPTAERSTYAARNQHQTIARRGHGQEDRAPPAERKGGQEAAGVARAAENPAHRQKIAGRAG